MAGAMQAEPQQMETEGVTKNDFIQLIKRIDNLEGGLIDKFNSLLKPLSESMEKFAVNLQQVSKIAEETKAVTLTQQSEIINLHNKNEKAMEQLVALSNRSRFLNLKLRRIPEAAKGDSDLVIYI